ncbi:methyltransferase domain-containing protein [Winogradskyella arenosi]|uniref:Thiopurine S-methyltransferase n=1 Tax=Winogradskyella arenosi TaxID=533325 RepID=A0A368ZIK5_9FLAO|nr:methyltransferase domain-containing protein [Winogradskyella arenosi]RCW91201.1 thiopurine S-methyltransferase [Winogradskyella arenosi]
MNTLDKSYWQNRYIKNEMGWNIGAPSRPLQTYINQLSDKTIKILIPGAGRAYEAEYLWQQGFKQVYVLDFASEALDHFKARVPDFPESQVIIQDFFTLKDQFDLILEQTFFCALTPHLRTHYVQQMHQLLKPDGQLVGLLFNFELTQVGPPFGGDLETYQSLFEPFFKIKTLEPAINSIKERQGKELFFIFEKKS